MFAVYSNIFADGKNLVPPQIRMSCRPEVHFITWPLTTKAQLRQTSKQTDPSGQPLNFNENGPIHFTKESTKDFFQIRSNTKNQKNVATP